MYNTKTPQVKQLSPSLAEIENYLFAPSFGLCQLVYNNDPSINVNIANGIKNSVAYKNFVETMEEQNSTRSNENFLADDNNNINFDETSIYEKEYNKLYNKLSKKYTSYELEQKIKQKLYQKGLFK